MNIPKNDVLPYRATAGEARVGRVDGRAQDLLARAQPCPEMRNLPAKTQDLTIKSEATEFGRRKPLIGLLSFANWSHFSDTKLLQTTLRGSVIKNRAGRYSF